MIQLGGQIMRDLSKLDKDKRIKVMNQIAICIQQLEKMKDKIFIDMLKDNQQNINTEQDVIDILNQLK